MGARRLVKQRGVFLLARGGQWVAVDHIESVKGAIGHYTIVTMASGEEHRITGNLDAVLKYMGLFEEGEGK